MFFENAVTHDMHASVVEDKELHGQHQPSFVAEACLQRVYWSVLRPCQGKETGRIIASAKQSHADLVYHEFIALS